MAFQNIEQLLQERQAQPQPSQGQKPDLASINQAVAQLPSYQAHASNRNPFTSINQTKQFAREVEQVVPPDVLKDIIFDPSSGQFREKTFMERHEGWATLIYGGSAVGLGLLGAGAAAGALGGAGGGAAAAGTGGAAAGGAGAAGTAAGTAAAGGLAGAFSNYGLPLAGTALNAYGQYRQGRDQNEQANRGLDLQAKALENQSAIQRASFNRENPSIQMGNSVRGDILANAQPASFTGSGRNLQRQGGLSPALFSDNTRQLGSQASRQALLAALGQDDEDSPYASPRFS